MRRLGARGAGHAPVSAIFDRGTMDSQPVSLLNSYIPVLVMGVVAIGLAAVLAQPGLFRGRRVCCVVTGGNVDPEIFVKILSRDR